MRTINQQNKEAESTGRMPAIDESIALPVMAVQTQITEVLDTFPTIPVTQEADQILKEILTTEGNVVHYGFIEEFIRQLGERFEIREIAYDRWNASMMVQALEDDGFTMVPFGQGIRDMSNPTKDLMRLVLEKSLRHNRHQVLRWNMDNVFIRTDPAGNLKIDKQKSTEKVDGAVALVMALDRAMKNQNSASVYDERGLLII